ncbi:MAG: C4-dicarboxylate ABC transporter permease [Gammaproteobacteria bacterium]|nr:MAG: C4-dicarboxylate ABC transporter permease [Gammaproteobacteria bacterium]
MTVFVLFFLLFSLMLIGVPVAFSLGLSSIITILFFSKDSLESITLKFLEATSDHYTLLAIPFFILSSAFLSTGGVAKRIIDFAIAAIGHIRGGLAMASVVACMIFAAISGSSPATVAAIGTIVIAGMVRAGYPESFATGVIANAGTLGILIPPSIVMLVYSAATEESASKMFMAGVIPGLMMGGLLMLAIYIVAVIKKFPTEKFAGFRYLFSTFFTALGGLMLIFLVLGSIYLGVASPTEAASVAAIYAFFVVVFGYRDIGPLKSIPWRKQGEPLVSAASRALSDFFTSTVKSPFDPEVRQVIANSVKVSTMLLFIIANAMIFAHVLTTEKIPHHIAEAITGMELSPWIFLIIVNILLLVAGNFMEPSAIILIMAPILLPIARGLGIDPIHLGIIMVVNMEIGMLTPPVGLNLFVASGITGRSMGWVIKACLPWLALLLFFLILITYIPQISLWLPETMSPYNK